MSGAAVGRTGPQLIRVIGRWSLTALVVNGAFIPVAGIAICAVLLTRVDLGSSLILVATITVALLNWLVTGRSSAARVSTLKPKS